MKNEPTGVIRAKDKPRSPCNLRWKTNGSDHRHKCTNKNSSHAPIPHRCRCGEEKK